MRFASAWPRLAIAASLLAIGASACADDPIVPPAGAPGDYRATRFALSMSGTPVNLLAAGASIALTLDEDHTTSGRLQLPASATGGEPIDANLTGSWRQSNDTVFFSGPADTFIRDVPFLIRGATLVADNTEGGTRLQVTLTK